MNKDEVLEQLCSLCTEVAEEGFDWNHPADCFCKGESNTATFQFSEEVLEFIESSVRYKIHENK